MNGNLKKIYLLIFLILSVASTRAFPQYFEIEDMKIKTAGYGISDGWVLDAIGYVADTITVEQAGFYRFNVRAKKIGNGSAKLPKMEIRVAGKTCGPVFVKQKRYLNIRLLCYLTPGNYQFAIWRTDDDSPSDFALDRVNIYPVIFNEMDWLVKAAESTLERFPSPWNYQVTDFKFEEIMWGMTKAYEQTGERRFLSYIRSFIDEHISENGDLDFQIKDITPGIIILWLYQTTGEAKYLIAAKKIGEYLLNVYPRTSEGAILHSNEPNGEIWIETLNSVGRFFGLLGALTGDSRYFDEGAKQFVVYASHLQDPNTGLFFHAWDEDRSADWSDPVSGNSPVFWARGNGWAFCGLADFLEFLPESHSSRSELVEILTKLAEAIREQQNEESGLWRTVFNLEDDSLNYEDTAAALLLTYGMAKAIRLHVLSDEFLPVAEKANRELYNRVYEEGNVGVFVTGISGNATPGNYQDYIGSAIGNDDLYSFVVGIFLQEKGEMVILDEPELKLFSLQIHEITDSSAVVSWSTNIKSNSRIDYGLSESYGNTITDPEFVKYHELQLSGLQPETLYYFRVISMDENGNAISGVDTNFVTLPFINLSFSNISFSAGFSGENGIDILGGHAVIFADVDGDDFPDIYLTRLFNEATADLFYHNEGNGKVTEQGAARGIADFDGGSHGACFADLDNDGDYDLINGTTFELSGSPTNNNLYENIGDGYFVEQTPVALRNNLWPTRSVLPFDMDKDGDLDIFAVSGYQGSQDPPDELNEVYRNDGNFNFVSIDTSALRFARVGQGASAVDYDNDGDIDVFAANRTGPFYIFQNDGSGNFAQINPADIGILHPGRESITFGDIDNDTFLDMLLVGDTTGYYGYLYKNMGDGTFRFVRQFESISGYMGNFADLDNDGDLDIVFAGDDVCYLNDGTGNFETGPEIPVDGANDPRAISFADFDRDGDLDFAVGCKRSRSLLIRNNLRSGNWLDVKLESAKGQAGAFGSRVYLYDSESGELILMQEAQSSQGYLGQNNPVLHFGVGDRMFVNVIVKFLDGNDVELANVPTNRMIFVKPEMSPLEIVIKPSVAVLDSEFFIGKEVVALANKAKSNLNHILQYQFDWGDGNTSSWGDSIQAHVYHQVGTFYIKARARCEQDTTVTSEWSDSLPVNLTGFICNVVVEPDSAGSVKIDPEKEWYEFNEIISLVAIADSGYEFDHWEGAFFSTENPYQFTVSANVEAKAVFSRIAEVISSPGQPQGPDSLYLGQPGIFISGGASSNLNHQVEYQFQWGDSTLSEWGDSTRSHSFYFPGDFGISVQARCKQHSSVLSGKSTAKMVSVRPINISINAVPDSGGIVVISPQKEYYAYLDTVTLTAIPAEEMVFEKWKGDFNSDSSELEIVLFHDVEILCLFEKAIEELAAPDSIIGKESVFRKQENTFIAVGGKSSFNHAIEYQFDWGDGSLSDWGDSSQSKVYFENGDYAVRCRVRCQEHPEVISVWSRKLTVDVRGCRIVKSVLPEGSGSVKLSPEKPDYDFGESVRLIANPLPNFKFCCWNIDGDSSLTKEIEVIRDTTVQAKFRLLSGVFDNDERIPDKFDLKQNYPNPFNGETLIPFQVPEHSRVEIEIYNITGQRILTLLSKEMSAGYHYVHWNGKDGNDRILPTGIYWLIMKSKDTKLFRKVIILR